MKKITKTQNKNQKFFYQNWFYIQKKIFLPRFETEQLVDLTINYAHNFFEQPIKILEVGTGSGVIALSLASYNPQWKIDAVDINSQALKLAMKNNKFLKINSTNFWKSNMFSNVKKKYDLVIANLPYVDLETKLDPQVTDWDPANALFAPEKGLGLINNFLQNVTKNLQQKYLIALEIGFLQCQRLIKLIKKYLPQANFKIKKDFNQIERFVFIYNLN